MRSSGMPEISAMMNTPAPITGGVIAPPVPAAVSIAAASYGLKPLRFISGIVIVPVVTTLAIVLPDTMPINVLPRTAAFAGPAVHRPAAMVVRAMKIRSPPPSRRKVPNARNTSR
jgi:hypothetical protein